MTADIYGGAPWLIDGECGYAELPNLDAFREEDVVKCRRQAVYELLGGEYPSFAVACVEHTAWARTHYGPLIAAVMQL